jgi:cytochrome c
MEWDMRQVLVGSIVLCLAAGLAGCGQSSSGGGEGAASSSGSAPAAPEPSLAQLQTQQASLPAPYNAADLANGKAKFVLCASCHTITQGGPNMTGPNLFGVRGRKAASAPNYNYSEALKASNIVWDADKLDHWLANPREFLPGNKMSFVGLKNAKDRTDVVAYVMAHAPQAQ